MRINHNLQSLNAYRQLTTNTANGSKSLEKLSSGLRINRAGDDAAGLAISEKMRGQIRGLDQASRNAQDGISLIQTAEGALNETQSILQRMRELAVQSSNDTNVSLDRSAIQDEINQLTSEIDRIATTTEFNTKTLLNGGAGLGTSFAFETVNTANADWISVIGGTADTAKGNLNNTASITAAARATSGSTSFTVGANAAGTQSFTLNGYTITYTATGTGTADDEAIVKAVNNITDKTGVTASVAADGNVYMYTGGVGSAAEIKLNSAASALSAAAISNQTYKGTDATITMLYDGVAVAATDYVASGNDITVIGGAAGLKGLHLRINGSAADATAANNDAEFNITGNGTLAFQIGANEGQTMDVSINDMSAKALGVNSIDVTSVATASSAITTVNKAITSVSTERAKLGAYQNRLEHTINNLGTSSENLTASESRVRDVDMAKEMMEFTKNNILNQAATAMLAQANQAPQGVLQLLR